MTAAQERLASFVEWIKASSTPRRAPLGRDVIDPGPQAILVPAALNLPPTPNFDPKHLPLWIAEQQAVSGLPSFTQDPPTGQGLASDRIRHLIWMLHSLPDEDRSWVLGKLPFAPTEAVSNLGQLSGLLQLLPSI